MDTGLQVVDPYQEMERADEQMVLDEIKGRAIDALVYEIKQGNETVTGLSLAGVRETARVMNKQGQGRIHVSDKEPTIIETEDYFEVRVYGVDEQNGGGNWGIKRQDKKYRNGNLNQFAYEQALAKAQRNALRGLIPEWFVKQMIDAYRAETGRVKTINQTAQRQQAPTHWALNRASYATFMAAANDLEMDREEILSALNVEKSTEFKGSLEDAIKALTDWHTAHPFKKKSETAAP